MSEEVETPVIMPAKSEDKLEIEKEEAEKQEKEGGEKEKEEGGEEKEKEEEKKEEEKKEEPKGGGGKKKRNKKNKGKNNKEGLKPKVPGFLRSKSKERSAKVRQNPNNINLSRKNVAR